MTPMKLPTLLVAVTLVAACASSPTPLRLHTLMTDDATAMPPAAATASPFAIEVLPVGLPPAVDQQPIVVRRGGGGDATLTLLETERWAGPLADELRGALAAQLGRRLGARDATGLGRPADLPLLRVKLEVRRFDSVPGAHALIEADWSLARSDRADAPRLLCGSVQRVAAGAGVDAVVQAHRQALAAIAAQIAGTARAWWSAPAAAACATP
jgi:uncharacterized lipoprotein YmbA